MRNEYPVTIICRTLDIKYKSYNKWINKGRNCINNYNDKISKIISEEHYNTKQVYGTIRLKHHIQNEYGIILNHKLIRRYKRYLKLQTITRKRRPLFFREQQKRNYHLAVPNQLKNNFTSTQRFEKISTDVSYINCTDGRLYLSAVKDLFNNEIISYNISNKNNTKLIINSLKDIPNHNGIIHSDQGSIYLQNAYKNYMRDKGYIVSMSRKGACWENSPIENWFSQLKEEHLRPIGLKSKNETRDEIKKYVDWYNTQRIQKDLGYLPPVSYR